MNTLKILLSCIVFFIAALVIWFVPITGVLGRLIVALIAAGVIVLFH